MNETGVVEVLVDLADVDDQDEVRSELIMRDTLAEVQLLPARTVLQLADGPITREQAIALLEKSIAVGVNAAAMRAGARRVFGDLARSRA
jgi:hypothetical protein